MAKPEVTIGICVRNSAAMLQEAIESIIFQDFPHKLMESIFIDDGSTDETLSIITRYAPRMGMKVRIFHHNWKGLGASRNVVVAHARGDFILWVDGDMILSKDYVTKQVEYMNQHPEVGIAKGKQVIESGGNLVATLESYSRVAGRMVDYNSKKGLSKSLGTGGCIYRIVALRQVDGFDELITGYGEDFDVEYRIRKAGWLLSTTDVQFRDYERSKISWKSLWYRYFTRGFDLHNFLREQKSLVHLYNMLPIVAFLAGLFHSFKIFKLTHQKIAFLLPFQYIFKTSALCSGYIRGSIVHSKTA